VRYWQPNELVFPFGGFLRLCQFWWKSIKKCDRESAHRRSDTLTDWQTQTDFIISLMLYAVAMGQIIMCNCKNALMRACFNRSLLLAACAHVIMLPSCWADTKWSTRLMSRTRRWPDSVPDCKKPGHKPDRTIHNHLTTTMMIIITIIAGSSNNVYGTITKTVIAWIYRHVAAK